jgi:UDP-glucose 4-epimerase
MTSINSPEGRRSILLTGGAGFFGEIAKRELLERGFDCVSFDVQPDASRHPHLTVVQGDLRDTELVDRTLASRPFAAVVHAAAVLAHATPDPKDLWSSNVDATRTLADLTRKHRIPRLVFVSSNCLWAENFGRPVREDDPPRPAELYGRSKAEGEKILWTYRDAFDVVIIRSPTIMDSGRLGLLAILYDFIREGRRVWVVGSGANRYQFIYAPDLADACIRAIDYRGSAIFGIGSDRVRSMREVYQAVIDRAGTGARVASLPKKLTLFGMKLAYRLGISPLGPYHYKMIAEDFEFDTTAIKRELGWKPTATNEEMLWKAYEYYRDHHDEIAARTDVSAHKKAAPLGVIRLVKWLS